MRWEHDQFDADANSNAIDDSVDDAHRALSQQQRLYPTERLDDWLFAHAGRAGGSRIR